MADAVLKLLGKILALIPDERRRLFDYLEVSCPATALTNSDRQRRHRLKSRGLPVTNRYADTVTKRNEKVTGNVTNRYGESSHLVSKVFDSSTAVDSEASKLLVLEADSKVLESKLISRVGKTRPSRPALTDAQFLDGLRSNPAYSGVDIDRELGKMDAWLSLPQSKGRQKTHRFILNWLNKSERVVTENGRGHGNGRHPGIDIQGTVEWPPKRKLVQPEPR